MPCFGVGVDSSQNVWGVSQAWSTRALVDKMGKITQPRLNAPPMGMDICPAGDQCKSNMGGEIISDFSGFNPARAASPGGRRYSRTIPSPASCAGAGRKTRWLRLSWEADVPTGTKLEARYRTGDSAMVDITWSGWRAAVANPDMLTADRTYLQVELSFTTSTPGVTPTLRSFTLLSECTN